MAYNTMPNFSPYAYACGSACPQYKSMPAFTYGDSNMFQSCLDSSGVPIYSYFGSPVNQRMVARSVNSCNKMSQNFRGNPQQVFNVSFTAPNGANITTISVDGATNETLPTQMIGSAQGGADVQVVLTSADGLWILQYLPQPNSPNTLAVLFYFVFGIKNAPQIVSYGSLLKDSNPIAFSMASYKNWKAIVKITPQ